METYDHIVIGAGSAGCAVAARLSEDPARRVLLIEAGGSANRLEVLAPLAFSNQFHSKIDWDYKTEPEPGCDNRRIYEPRGKVLGGCSSMNAMLWLRGHRLDYDGWGIEGWGWDDVRPVFERIERRSGIPGYATNEDGPIHVTRQRDPDPLTEMFIEAARAAGVPASEDLSDSEEGAGPSSTTIWKGRRWNAARAYLGPAKRRSNLTVLKKALVKRVVVREGRAVGVEWERRGRKGAAAASGDIVLAAGAFNTPHLLQLSGIGPAEHLKSVGIEPLLDSPGVGSNLQEHAMTLVNWELREGHIGLSDATHPKYLVRWLAGGRGKLASNIAEALALIRTDDSLEAPDFELLFGPAFFWEHGAVEHPKPAMVIAQSLWTPKSRGTVLARSADPKELPAVQLNMLTEREDVDALIRAIRRSREIGATQPMASMIETEIHPGSDAQSDEELERWIRSTCEHTYHPACTARIGPEGEGVVDAELRVHGIEGLRVADASILPVITRANTNAPAIMIGERCASFIRAA
jgi:choline dehydrogenase